jgi:hypothetical protein
MIERYIRYPDSLDAEARQAVETALSEDDAARSVARHYLTLYRTLDEVAAADVPEAVRALAEELSNPAGGKRTGEERPDEDAEDEDAEDEEDEDEEGGRGDDPSGEGAPGAAPADDPPGGRASRGGAGTNDPFGSLFACGGGDA